MWGHRYTYSMYTKMAVNLCNKLTKGSRPVVSGGFTSRSEHYRDQNSSTSLGLVTEKLVFAE